MFLKRSKLIVLILFFMLRHECIPAIHINEIMAVNVLSYVNKEGEYEDWIELYNSGDLPVDISGYYLANDPLKKWQIAAGTTIPAKGFKVFIADGITGIPLHTSFSLKKEGEEIYLYDPDGINVIDHLQYPEQLREISYGRIPDGGAQWNYMDKISPGSLNKPGYLNYTQAPGFNVNSGFYSSSIKVSIESANPGDIIRYTTDGSDPREGSQLYSTPIVISNTCILKARAFLTGYLPGEISERTLLINYQSSLPVFSLITDPKNLYDPFTGIYNHDFDGRAWERYSEAEYFTDNKFAFHISAGIRIQGNTGPWDFRKKSFRLFFRKGYGQDQLNQAIYAHDKLSNTRLVLRSGYDDSVEPRIDGTDNIGTLIRDPLITELWRRTGKLIPQSKLASLFLNGTFFGIYDIKQSIDEDFVKSRMGYADVDIMRTRWDSTELVYGSRAKWIELVNFFENNNFESDAMLQEAAKRLDLDNYLTLQAFVHAAQFASWSHGVFMVREKTDDAQWKLILWDADRAFTDVNWNAFTASLSPVGTMFRNVICNSLLQNQSFKRKYINRTADILNTFFEPGNIKGVIDSLAGEVRNEIPAEAAKWNFAAIKWEQNITELKSFTEQRSDIVRNQFLTQFGLEGISTLTLEKENSGKIKVNTIIPDHYPWTGKYFRGLPVTLKAMPSQGYIFERWDDLNLPNNDSLEITLSEDRTIKAVFRKLESSNIELIAPASIPVNHDLPVILRIRDENWKINPVDQSPIILARNGSVKDTSINIKRGAGSGMLKIGNSSSFILNAFKENSPSINKNITVSTLPDNYYSGYLPAGEVIWDNTSIRHINNNLSIPAGTTLRIKQGTWVLISKNIITYIRGKLIIEGTKDEPVVITSETNDAWGGMEFTAGEADFTYCIVTNGGGDPSKGKPTAEDWHTGRQHIFFGKDNSLLNFINCFFLFSPGKVFGAQDSRVNVSNSLTSFVWHGGEFHRTLLNYKDSHLMNLPNDDHIYLEDIDTDGFHIDFVNPNYPQYSVIENCFFVTGKDDAIDHHAARLKINNCWLEDFTHEGVAASGGDTVMIFNTVALKNDQGFEAGWTESGVDKGPVVIIDHCTAIDNNVGLRIGDSYAWSYRDFMKVTNTVLYNNKENIWNYLNSTHAPLAGAIDISFSMTNDEDYSNSPHSINGIPQFDAEYYLLPGSPGSKLGWRGTNMGRADSSSVNLGLISINEIMYNGPADLSTGDWIELYNHQDTEENLSGWVIKDDNNSHMFIIPNGTIIPGKSYLVVCSDTSTFSSYHPGIDKYGNIEFGFGEEDQVRLYDEEGLMMDSVLYSGSAPWDEGANGKGYSLELLDAGKVHNNSANWKRSIQYGGSPGFANQYSGTTVQDEGKIFHFNLYQNYPNPFNPVTRIRFEVPYTAHVELKIFDIIGREVHTLLDEVKEPGVYEAIYKFTNAGSGVYFYRLVMGNLVSTKKMVILK